MARYTTISEEEVIAFAKRQLLIANTTEHDGLLSMYINEALGQLNALSTLEKRECILDIVDNKSKLPDTYQRLLALRFTGTNTQGEDNCFSLLYVDKPFLTNCGCDTTNNNLRQYTNTMQIQHGFIYYNTDINATEVAIAYMGLHLDEYGRIVIYERYERALRSYACYMFALAYPKEFTESTTERYHKTWKSQKAFLKGEDVQNDFQQNKYEMGKIFKTLLLSDFINV